MFRNKIISILTTPIFSTSAPAEVEEEFEFEENLPLEALESGPIYSRFPFPSPVAVPVATPVEVVSPVEAVSPAEATFQKVKAAQEAALAKKGELMGEQLLQEKTKNLLQEMDEAGLLPRQLFHLELEVMQNQSELNDLIDQLGF